MAMSGYYLDPTSSDSESIRTIQRALELGDPHRHRRDLRPVRQRGARRPRAHGTARRCRARDEVRLRLARRRRPRSARQQPGEHPDRGRRLPEAAGHRPHRPLLPAPGRPRTPRSRTPLAPWPSWLPRERVLHIGLSEASPATIRRAYAVHSIAATVGVLAVDPLKRVGRAAPAAARAPALASCPARRSGTASSPERSAPRGSRRRRLAQEQSPLHRGQPERTSHRRRGRAVASELDPHRRRSR